ncbi:hypothetical protein FGK63_10715 [Ruegeria sediminis]|uniref:MurNAc-LAA domain-containing protein n=1 Tax=Ruegeria sediminis TaxID=2583820 RepID=A0ABY2WYI9_9RHOB|nr:glucosaminidase domain-containing protein [Ruegeria sediminis]TMV07916.1 hypothetical protein FGK63_10715 [Ruegeria sediminis]
MTKNWKKLIRTYAEATIPAPTLKLITLAQWALESNFGKSELAKEHLNFSGLKFRARVNAQRPLAEAVDYQAHDGWGTYCKFASLQDFIDGYWAFVSNGPMYDGWEGFADDPSGYVGHLHRNGFAQDPDYFDKIMQLLPRVREQVGDLGFTGLLETSGLQPRPRFKLAVLIGHNSVAQGAFSERLVVSEWHFNQRVYTHLAELAPEYEIEPKQFFRQKSTSYEKEIAEAYAAIDAWGPDAVIELHFNAGGGHGTEMLYWDGSRKGKLLAEALQDAVLSGLGLRNRGAKGRRSGRGSSSLKASSKPTVLTEPFFGDSAGDCAVVASVGEETLARAYLIGARDALEAF